MAISRLVYFFSAAGLLFYTIGRYREFKERELLMGRPLVENSIFRRVKPANQDSGTFIKYSPSDGWKIEDLNADECLDKSEQEAYQKAYAAQKAAIEAGRTLPPGALVLVDEKDIKRTKE